MAAEEFARHHDQPDQTVIVSDGEAAIVIEDASLLFGADFLRDGPDLVLRNEGAADIRIVDYFRAGAPVELQSPDGGTLRGHVVERLAGPDAPGQYAQAGQATTSVPIGQVETVDGTASVQRTDGTTEPLTQSTRIFLGDVVQTVGDSTLSITFADGTIFTLAADSRMVIDDLIYSPDGNGNSATFNLVQGGFVFIAGQVARTGGMEVNTPAATMGIRGTTVLTDIQTEAGVSTVEVALIRDPNGDIGRMELFNLAGDLVATISSIGSKWIVSAEDGLAREVDRTAEEEAADDVLIADAVAAFQQAQGRFAQEGSFIDLDTLSRDRRTQDGEGNGGQNEIDLDSQDADEIPEIDDAPEPEDGGNDSFDEGRLDPLREDPVLDVFRTALEDSEDDPVSGQLSTETNLQGEYILVSSATNGVVSLSPDGSFSYAPAPDFNGIDQFTYSVRAADGTSTFGTVTIDVLPVNDAPEIEDAAIDGVEDNVVLGRAIASDVDSPVLTYSLAAPASNGTVVVTSTGAWSYTPDANFAGTDSFDIGVSDGDGAGATQRVTLTIAGVNDAPVVDVESVPDAPTVFEDIAPTISGQLTATDPDAGDVFTWSGSSAGNYGTFTIAATGAWSYTLGPAANALRAGQEVTDSFTATVTDAAGASTTQEISIAIVGGNDAPEIEDVSLDGVEDNVVLGTAIASDVDSPVLTYSLAAPASNGTVVVTSSGAWSYTPDANFAGTDSFDIGVSDGDGAGATQRVTLTIAGVNDAPVVDVESVPDAPTVFEDTAPTISGQLTATDPDAGDVFTWSGSSPGNYGTFTIAATGAWSYTLGPAANALRAGQGVTDSFTATVTDAAGASTTQEISIAIVGGNDAPTASFFAFAVLGGEGLDATLTATDPDVGDTLTFTLGALGPAHGTLDLQEDGSFTYVPEAGYAGLDGFDYVVTDASGASASARANLAVESGTVVIPGGGQVSVSIYPDPEVGPAGQIVASSTDPDITRFNIVFALDQSGSILPSGWNTTINAVADALETLAANFVGAATQVDVNVIRFANQAVSIGSFDLTDPGLIATIRSLPFTGGGTNWSPPLELAESFFDAQPPGEANYLYFVSDGEPFDSDWPDVLARMTDAEAKGYTLEVEAFGIGPSLDEATLAILDPDPVSLDGPGDLLAAIEASPLFAPELADLSVRLTVDGQDLGEVADETAPGITVDGLDTKLALADIAGLANLLGESNFVSVTAGFDLDGDPTTSEVELFTSQVFAKQAQATTLNGTDESDLLFGSDLADQLAGNGGNDILLGFGGDDLISTGAGLDHVSAGAGNDRILLESLEAPSGGFATKVDGGPGRDVLAFGFGGDLTSVLPLVDLSGIEALDLENGQSNTLDLTLEDVLGLSDEADSELEALLGAALPESLTVYGDDTDTLTLTDGAEGGFVDTGNTVTDGADRSLDIYTYVSGGEVLATLAVDSDVAVTMAPASG